MEEIDRKILNILQEGLPLTPRPYLQIGKTVERAEKEVVRRARRLKDKGIIREMGPLFNPALLGYRSTLVAMEIPPSRIDKAATLINQHPGVSHNYRRDHPYNLWFTLAIPQDISLKEEIDRVADKLKPGKLLNLPVIRAFKIQLNLTSEKKRTSPKKLSAAALKKAAPHLLPNEVEKHLIRSIQGGQPIVTHPFRAMARKVGLGEEELITRVETLRRKGILRRWGATIDPRKLGYRANVLVIWRVNQRRLPSIARTISSHPVVTHCYQRATYPHWPYNLYTVIHCRNRREAREIIQGISEKVRIKDYQLLFSLKEYKNRRIRYLL